MCIIPIAPLYCVEPLYALKQTCRISTGISRTPYHKHPGSLGSIDEASWCTVAKGRLRTGSHGLGSAGRRQIGIAFSIR